MPRYEYQATNAEGGCVYCRAGFEVRQSMQDPPVEKCPRCGGAVRRLVSLRAVARTPSVRSMLSDRNLKDKGFTKFVKEGEGRYRKTV